MKNFFVCFGALAMIVLVYIAIKLANCRTAEIKKLRELVNRDYLTGMYNSRYYGLMLKECITALNFKFMPFSIISLDIDGFKQVNDTYGHLTGDVALRHVTRILIGCINKDDFVCRVGGDEFIIILPGRLKADALAVAEQMRAKVEQHGFFSHNGHLVKVTLSLGVMSYSQQGHTELSVRQKVDEVLYSAKKSGKNQVMTIK